MQSLAVEEALDVREDCSPHLVERERRPAIEQLCFDGANRRFSDGIVPAIALAAHAGRHAERAEPSNVATTGVLHSSVRVVQQAWDWSITRYSCIEGREGKL